MNFSKIRLIAFVVAIQWISSDAQAAIAFGNDAPFMGNFSVFNDGDLFQVTLSDGSVGISKPADNGSFNSAGFVTAGIRSAFSLIGDFSVTVRFELIDFPHPVGTQQLNESLLAVVSDSGALYEVLRFNQSGGRSRVEAFTNPFVPLPAFNSSLDSGVYNISRTGSTISGWISPSDGSTLTFLGSASGFTDPMHVQLFAAQGANSGDRSTTSLGIGFSQLTVQADQINGIVPEPPSIALWCILALLASGGQAARRLGLRRNVSARSGHFE